MSEQKNEKDRIIALVGDHIYDHTEWDTGVKKCRQHPFSGHQANCPQAWLRDQFPDLFPPDKEN